MVRNVSKSVSFYEINKNIIPEGSSTLAKSPNRLEKGYSPFYAEEAHGSHFVDIDGNDWLDCEMAMGTAVWGHNNPRINNAMLKQIQKGVNFSIPSTLEYELGCILLNRFPMYKAVKFFKNGGDSVYAAVRSSRFFSKKDKVLSCEYHGWHDWCSPSYYNCSPSQLGIPNIIDSTHIHCKKDAAEIKKNILLNFTDLACVVLCPANYDPVDLKEIIRLCKNYNIYTIFDEVTSGIRYAYGGVSTYYKLTPDFLCLSKGLTNGLPLAVVLGPKNEILSMSKLKISNAHSSENLALAAAIECEHMLHEQRNNWPTWKNDTQAIINQILKFIANNNINLHVDGSTACFSISTPHMNFYEDNFRKFLLMYMADLHIFTKGYFIFSTAHTSEEILFVGKSIIDCIKEYCL